MMMNYKESLILQISNSTCKKKLFFQVDIPKITKDRDYIIMPTIDNGPILNLSKTGKANYSIEYEDVDNKFCKIKTIWNK